MEKAAQFEYYGGEAMTAGAAELASYIQDADAITHMMDTLADYSMGMSGGGALSTQQVVDYATQLGKALDGTYDGLKKKGFDLTDLQKEIIENGTDMQKALVLEDVIGQSWAGLYDNMSNTPEGQIQKLSNSFGTLKAQVGERLYPHVLRFVDVIRENMPQLTALVHGFGDVAGKVVVILSAITGAAIAVASAFQENWGWIGPIIGGVTMVLGLYTSALLVHKGAVLAVAASEAVLTLAKQVQAAATMLSTGETLRATIAQHGFNAALLACPLTWIVGIIIVVISVFYAAVAAVNHFAGTTYSATGMICGAILTTLAFIGNLFVGLWNLAADAFTLIYNLIATVANFVGNVFNDPIGAICRLFFDLADTVLGVIQSLASALDTVFGSNLSGAVQGWRDNLGGWVESTFGSGVEVMAKMDANSMKLDRFDYSAAYDRGYHFGSGLEDKIGGFFNSGDLAQQQYYDNTSAMADELAGIGGDTGTIRDSVEVTNEDLKYLRDLAEREVINRFTTAEIKVEMVNHNQIGSSVDQDSFIGNIADQLEEALFVVAEGAPTY